MYFTKIYSQQGSRYTEIAFIQCKRHAQPFTKLLDTYNCSSANWIVSIEAMEEQGVANFQTKPAKDIVRLQAWKVRPLETSTHAKKHCTTWVLEVNYWSWKNKKDTPISGFPYHNSGIRAPGFNIITICQAVSYFAALKHNLLFLYLLNKQ